MSIFKGRYQEFIEASESEISYEMWLEIQLFLAARDQDFLVTEYRNKLIELEWMLYQLTSAADWEASGYTEEEYKTMMSKFENDICGADEIVDD